MKNCDLDIVVDFKGNGTSEEAIDRLKIFGVVVLRNTSDPLKLEALITKTKKNLSQPALLGSTGYCMKDPHKMLCEGFMVGEKH